MIQQKKKKMVGAQAIIAREPEQHSTPNWSLEEIGVHDPGDGEVLVEVYASGICHTDIVLTSVPDGILGMNYPKIAGHEGIVTFSIWIPPCLVL